MIEKFIQKLKELKGSESLKFDAQQKARVRAHLEHMIDAQQATLVAAHGFSWTRFLKAPAVLAAAAIIIVGSGTAFAAQGSLPGNPLYGVKIHVNEKIEGALAVSKSAKANYEASLATRRLQEASRLALAGTLDEKTGSELQSQFEAHAAAAQQDIADLQASGDVSGASDAQLSLQSDLKTQKAVLARVASGNTSTAARAAAPLAMKIASVLHTTKDSQNNMETSVSASGDEKSKEAASAKLVLAARVISEGDSYLNQHSSSLDASTTDSSHLQLTTAADLNAQAKEKFDAKQYGEAFALASKASSYAQEARTIAQASGDLHVGIALKSGDEGDQGDQGGPTSHPAAAAAIAQPAGNSGQLSGSFGNLTLAYADGTATLSGSLNRSAPCIHWNASTTASSVGTVEFDITNTHKGMMCIQVLGTPQEIKASVSATANATYVVKIENETIFSGTLK